MKLGDIIDAYVAEGFNLFNANSRASQDVILALIARTPLADNVTIKGGVIMQRLSGSKRRATQDFDFDFIRHSLNDDSIGSFIGKLNAQADGITVSINSPIEELKHQDYKGKRVYVTITDGDGTSIDTKLDIGVHKYTSIKQETYCFDISKVDGSVTLLVNTKEQILSEKVKSLLRLGIATTRYKDIFDMYWLAVKGGIDKDALLDNLNTLIFSDTAMRERNMNDIASRLSGVLGDPHFINLLSRSKRHNWLNIDVKQATNGLLRFFSDY